MTVLNRLVVLDMSTQGALSRYLLRRAQHALAGPAPTALLLQDPNSRASGVDWGTGDLLVPAQFVSAERRAEAQDWTHRVSTEVVGQGHAIFPEVPGCDFAALTRLGLETYLNEYALLAAAGARLHELHDVRQTLVLTTDRAVASALTRVWRSRVTTRTVGRPRLLRRALAFLPRRPASSALQRRLGTPEVFAAAARGGRARVLLVVESWPMAQMFDAIEPWLDAMGVTPRVRVDYSKGVARAAVEPAASGSVLHLGRSDQERPADPYRFLDRLTGALEALEPLETNTDLEWLGGPPPLSYWLESMYLGELATIADQTLRARQIIEQVRPDLVVVGNDRWWLGQSFVRAARASSIPTLWVQDGIPIDSPVYFWMTADRLAASSDWLPETLGRHGIANHRWRVTGQPRYDALVSLARTLDRNEVRRRLGLHPEARYALVATQPLQSAAYAREVVEALLRVPSLNVLLRPHPSQDHADLAAVAAAMPPERVSFRPADSVFDLLAACDLMVNQFSTVTIEAAILGRPVITANFSGLPDPVPYARFGLSSAAEAMADITHLAERLLATGDQEFRATPQGMQRLVGPTDGQAASRVAELICEMLPPRTG